MWTKDDGNLVVTTWEDIQGCTTKSPKARCGMIGYGLTTNQEKHTYVRLRRTQDEMGKYVTRQLQKDEILENAEPFIKAKNFNTVVNLNS